MNNSSVTQLYYHQVEDVQQLCEECGIAQNDTIKMIDYLKVRQCSYCIYIVWYLTVSLGVCSPLY